MDTFESEEFSSKLNKNDILDILRKFKYNKSEYCIVYKASLVMQGVIDECNDVDISISKKLHNQLIKDGYKPVVAPLGGPKFTINDRLECFTEDSYMTDAVKVNGYNCKSINHCLEEYKRRNRPKDQSTIKRIEEYLAESCKDLSEARKFVSEVKDIAKKYDANFFIVTDGASGYSNDGTNDAVKNAREAQKKWEKEKGFDPDEDWSKDSNINEAVIFDDKKIFHNKDKWDSGEINIVFITGHSGAAKSTTGAKMATESYSLDDVIEQYRFTDANFKEYGDLISSYFKGPGKKYRISLEEIQKTTTEKTYEIPVLNKFIDYAIKYAKSHKDKKFCVEGIQLFQWFEPSRFKNYPVIILGTSVLKSNHRASLRDAQDADNKLQKAAAYTKNILSPKHYVNYLDDEKYLKKWRDYYKDDVVQESVSTFLDDTISKAERKSAEKRDYKDMMKLDGVRSSNKIVDKVLKTSDKAVNKTMKALDKPAGAVNNATNKAIHKTVGGGVSLYNKFTKKKIEAEKKREIEAKAGIAVKGAAFVATKLVPMGPVDWMLNLIAVTKVPKSDDPIDKEMQKVVDVAKTKLTEFRKDVNTYANEDRKYASAKDQIKDLERLEGKYEPVAKKLALMVDNLNKKRKEGSKSNSNFIPPSLEPAYESTSDLSLYTDKLDTVLLNSSGELLESSYDILYDFIFEEGNEKFPVYEIVNHYLNI